jgi:hypothetical protein
LGTPLKKEVREGHITGSGMYGNAPVDGLNALDRFQGGTGGIFHGFFYGHAATNSAGRINTGSLGFIGETNKI